MVTVMSMDEGVSAPMDDERTLILLCPVCSSDASETIGITGTMDGSLQETVIMECQECSTVYFSPRPASAPGGSPRLPATILTDALVRGWTKGLPSDARVLCIDIDGCECSQALTKIVPASWSITGVDSMTFSGEANSVNGKYDLILLPLTLEAVSSPRDLMNEASKRLTQGGRIVSITFNAGSSSFGLFGGRHWDGYRFPETSQHFARESLERLASETGFGVQDVRTHSVPSTWLKSARRWLSDWNSGAVVTAILTGHWLVPQIFALVLEQIASARGRGSVVTAVFSQRGVQNRG